MATEELPKDDPHIRPDGASDELVKAVGTLSEAVEYVERARGALYEFHQLIGHADFVLEKAANELAGAGHEEMSDLINKDMIGRNVIDGRWTFQVVEDFDDNYWSTLRHVEKNIRDRCLEGRRHVFESEMKERRRSKGRPHHESRP